MLFLGEAILLIDKRKFNKLLILVAILCLYIPVLLGHRYDSNSDAFIKLVCISSLIIYLFEIWCIYDLTKRIFTPTVLFLAAFYLFQNGQLLLLALGIDFNSFYINTLREYLTQVVVFSSVSNVLAGFVAVLTVKTKNIILAHNRKIDRYSQDFIVKSAKIGLICTGVITFPLIFLKTSYSLAGGYNAVRAFEETIPSIINLIEYMFIPYALLYMVYKGKKQSVLVRNLIIVWALLTALCGDRTTGIGALVVVVYFSYLNSDNEGFGKIILKYVGLAIIGLSLIVFIQVAYSFRIKGTFTYSSIFDIIINTISDLGFNSFPLFTMMSVVPGSESFLYGKGYLLSLIGGFIPSFVDITGTISKINAQSRIFETWQSKYFGQYSFGFGFSLNSEAYINFGWFGLIAIFIVLIVILKLLNSYNADDKEDLWGCYRTCILVFLWFTLPRRDSYYIWKAILYSLVMMRFYLLFMKSIIRKN